MSLPSASVNGDLSSSYACDFTISPSATISRTSFGISRPTNGLPGMISTTRTLTVASERARSLARLLIWLLLTPAAGFSSKRVTTGPGMHGDDLGLDAEIVELELDEPRHRFQRLGRVAALFRRRIVEQRQRRQLARLRRLEHRHLALALEPLASRAGSLRSSR